MAERSRPALPARAGVLRSVNVGLPRDVRWRGRTVHTGVWKKPVNGPRTVRRLNVDGDGQGDLAGHGGEQRAVLVYQLASYRYWQHVLGRDDFTLGQFGENFTVEGLADSEVCIGDRYRIGEALFEVTQPRVTCYRVGLRLEDPRIPALLVSHRRPGFYLRVLVEGQVRAGDTIVKVADGPEGMTVADVDTLLYSSEHPRDRLVRALSIPALSPGWQASFAALLHEAERDAGSVGNAGLTEVGPPPAWRGFRPLLVTGVEQESATVSSFHLADPEGRPLPSAAPGQFLTLRIGPGAGGQVLLRPYSMSGPPDTGRYRISVKRETHGVGSRYLHDHVRRGDALDVAAPRGTFTLRPGARPVALVSAGVGATPVLAMLYALAASGRRETWWLHGARDGSAHAFAAESASLLATIPRAHRCVCYSSPGPLDRHGHDYDVAGRLSHDVLAGQRIPSDAETYICGPAPFMDAVAASLVTEGHDRARIHTEVFGTRAPVAPGITAASRRPPHPPTAAPGTGPAVSFSRSDLTVAWDPAYGSVLELAEACDVPTRWSCRTGVCHTCETAVLSGRVGYSPDPVARPADGNALICCAQPLDDLVLDL